MADETENPWAVASIDAYNFLCCPECFYRSKDDVSFQAHAIENHPKSRPLFNVLSSLNDNGDNNLFYSCPECSYKSKDPNIFQIHALEKHSKSMSFFTKSEKSLNTIHQGNVWDVGTIEDFQQYCCTECDFKAKEGWHFQNHLVQQHLPFPPPEMADFLPIETKPFKTPKTPKSKKSNISKVKIKPEPEDDYDDYYDTGNYDNYMENSLEVELKENIKDEKNVLLQDKKPVIKKKRKKRTRNSDPDPIDEDEGEITQDPDDIQRTCSECNETFSGVVELSKHFHKEHTKDPTHVICPLCPKYFRGPGKMFVHARADHLNAKKKCDECGEIYKLSVYKQHKIRKHGPGKSDDLIKCDKCNYSTYWKSLYTKHAKQRHSGIPKIKNFQCDKCAKAYEYEYQLVEHTKLKHEGIAYKCDFCPKTYSVKKSVDNHVRTAHPEQADGLDKANNESKIACELCFKMFSSEAYLQRHIREFHSNDSHRKEPRVKEPKYAVGKNLKQYTCDKCHLIFDGKLKYRAHYKEVHNDTVSIFDHMTCSSCEKPFTASSYYIQHHQSVHGGLPPEYKDKELFQCDQCPLIYLASISLSVHRSNKHRKELPPKAKPCFICVYCGKNFSQQGNFEEHVKVKHENSATFNCPECPRSFGTSKKLNNHKKLVHMRVKCEVCGQEICNSFMLRRHKASAHGIVPKDVYQCKLCPMFFSLELSLDKHIESKHGIIKPEFRGTL